MKVRVTKIESRGDVTSIWEYGGVNDVNDALQRVLNVDKDRPWKIVCGPPDPSFSLFIEVLDEEEPIK